MLQMDASMKSCPGNCDCHSFLFYFIFYFTKMYDGLQDLSEVSEELKHQGVD